MSSRPHLAEPTSQKSARGSAAHTDPARPSAGADRGAQSRSTYIYGRATTSPCCRRGEAGGRIFEGFQEPEGGGGSTSCRDIATARRPGRTLDAVAARYWRPGSSQTLLVDLTRQDFGVPWSPRLSSGMLEPSLIRRPSSSRGEPPRRPTWNGDACSTAADLRTAGGRASDGRDGWRATGAVTVV